MKRTLFGLLLLLWSGVFVHAKSFHLVYIQLDNTMNYALVNQKLDVLLKGDKGKGISDQDYLVFYANSNPVRIFSKQELDMGYLHHLISNNQQYGVQMSSIKESLLELFAQQNICVVKNLNSAFRVETNEQYESINLYCFVGNDFFAADFQNQTLGFLLESYNLLQNNKVNLFYYNTQSESSDYMGRSHAYFSDIFLNPNVNITLR